MLTTTPPFKTYPECLDFLHALDVSVMKLGTDRIEKVLQQLGCPQDAVPTIHVAGTNGKGSVCAMLESIYRHAGYQTGLFISPHLMDVRERIQLNGQLITPDQFVQTASLVLNAMHKALPQRADWLTYFEFIATMAFALFAEHRVDVAIIETGLGGRLDATNVIRRPLASVITSISMDHMERLGSTLAAIASEKAGIIKPGAPVVICQQHVDALKVLTEKAQSEKTTLTISNADCLKVGPLVFDQYQAHRLIDDTQNAMTYRLPLLGRYQLHNLALVLRVIEACQTSLPVAPERLSSGIASVNWPGRLQLFLNQQLLVDGSHNAAGIHTLLDTLQHDLPDYSILWGLSLTASRPTSHLETLITYANTKEVYLIEPSQPNRFHAPADLIKALSPALPENTTLEITSLDRFLNMPVSALTLKVVTGSLYTAGDALKRLSFLK